ncbi:hypothetical protein PC39_07674 [Salinisphaera sp. PC39]|uniref:peptidylprolyl isomerase n=1 Tax=Salinisphaera sp. PC39 TaxID=1304156 RepID=UPI00333F4294
MNDAHRHPRTTAWLAAGMFGGLVLAVAGLIDPGAGDAGLPENAVARVDGRVIGRDTYTRALKAVAEDKRDPLDDADRRQVLERLVNESLLIAHGLDLDLVRQSPRLRDQLVDEVLQGIRAQSDSRALSRDEVERFYRRHRALFTGPELLHVGVIRTGDRAAAARASDALRDGMAFSRVLARFDDGTGFLPDGPLPADKLRDYLGPELTRRAEALPPGDASEPIESRGRHVVLMLHARRAAEPPPLAQVESAVRHEIRRRRAEALLRERLAALRERYPVTVAPDVPQ